jgi:Glycosyl transferase family 11
VTRDNIIAVKLAGGLGNQLFQYAAGRAVCSRLGCRLTLDLSGLTAESAEQISRPYMLHALYVKADLHERGCDHSLEDYHERAYCYESEFSSIKPRTRLIGYFQSELYFAAFEDLLRQEIKIAVPTSSAFSSLAESIGTAKRPVSIHLRRGDFVKNPDTKTFHGTCQLDYYYKAMQIIEGLDSTRPTYIVFSDDRQEAVRMFAKLNSVVFAETPLESPWEDLFLMSSCRDNILANSSLSWWASWINPNPKKLIVAPRRWVSPEAMRRLNTCDLYLEGTIII